MILSDYQNYTGQAMSMGERSPIALLNPKASAKMAVGEAITNIASTPIADLSTVRLSANWMAAADHPGEGAGLYDAVQAIGMDMCPALGLTIPVGKDSMSMKAKWIKEDHSAALVTSPLSLIITAYGPVKDARRTLTPELRTDNGDTRLLFIDLAKGKQRLGASCLAQVYNQLGEETPDVEDYSMLKAFFQSVQALLVPTSTHPFGKILAYHDRSDGGLFTTILEMCFAGHCGCSVALDSILSHQDPVAALFNEELGAVIQVSVNDIDSIIQTFVQCGFPAEHIHQIGTVLSKLDESIKVTVNGVAVFENTRTKLWRTWAETSYRMQSLRDDPECALQEYNNLLDDKDPGLSTTLTFDFKTIPNDAGFLSKPKVAILREQGINSFAEMAWAFESSGFEAVDVHMTDIIAGRFSLSYFTGLACPGGFSYGDVLGAGIGWASSKF